jgi:hypothetical protein
VPRGTTDFHLSRPKIRRRESFSTIIWDKQCWEQPVSWSIFGDKRWRVDECHWWTRYNSWIWEMEVEIDAEYEMDCWNMESVQSTDANL